MLWLTYFQHLQETFQNAKQAGHLFISRAGGSRGKNAVLHKAGHLVPVAGTLQDRLSSAV